MFVDPDDDSDTEPMAASPTDLTPTDVSLSPFRNRGSGEEENEDNEENEAAAAREASEKEATGSCRDATTPRIRGRRW